MGMGIKMEMELGNGNGNLTQSTVKSARPFGLKQTSGQGVKG